MCGEEKCWSRELSIADPKSRTIAAKAARWRNVRRLPRPRSWSRRGAPQKECWCVCV